MKALFTTTFAVAGLLLVQLTASAQHVFAAKGSDFEVTFPAKPSIETEENVTIAKTVGPDALLNAGFVVGDVKRISRERVVQLMKGFVAELVGAEDVLAPTGDVKWETGKFGDSALLTGQLSLKEGSTSKPYSYEIRAFRSSSTILVIYTATEKARYPTKSIQDFISSARLKGWRKE